MRAYERLLEYVKVKTPSSEENMETPSSSCQFELAERLVEGYENSPSLGFIAHMDTVSEFTENPIHPVLHENYDGQNLVFDEGGRVLDTVLFPHLKNLKGRTLITSDGTTILGADDKAGIAEIMTMAEYVLRSDVPHGKICLAFTPDENFNACEAVFKIQGVNVHPGSAKGIMVNAGAVGCEIQMMLPQEETPEQTEGYEGFYHLIKISGSCERAELIYIVRDHDADKFAQKQQKLKEIADAMNQKYGEGTVDLQIKEQYRNMAEKIRPCYHLIENAKKACENVGIVPKIQPIRGGTDGARLSFMGLPCPNLGTGGYAFHGPYEHITVEGMDKSVEILMELVKIYGIIKKE